MNDINFDLLLNENFFDYFRGVGHGRQIVDFYIYKNPDLNEIERYICRSSRGMAMSNGSIYMEGYEERGRFSTIIHNDIIEDLHKKRVIPTEYLQSWKTRELSTKMVINVGVPIIRFADSNRIGLSESIYIGRGDKPLEKAITSVLKGCQSMNPYWTFVNNK